MVWRFVLLFVMPPAPIVKVLPPPMTKAPAPEANVSELIVTLASRLGVRRVLPAKTMLAPLPGTVFVDQFCPVVQLLFAPDPPSQVTTCAQAAGTPAQSRSATAKRRKIR